MKRRDLEGSGHLGAANGSASRLLSSAGGMAGSIKLGTAHCAKIR